MREERERERERERGGEREIDDKLETKWASRTDTVLNGNISCRDKSPFNNTISKNL